MFRARRAMGWKTVVGGFILTFVPGALPVRAGAQTPGEAKGAQEVGCAYWPNATASSPDVELGSYERCGREKADGTAEIAARHLAALDFGPDTGPQGLATLRLGQHFYYVRRDGRSARVPDLDNWADDFADGLVRTVRTVDGVEKVGYLDTRLEVAIPPRYDWGFPFADGRAVVCIGCRLDTPDDDGHRSVSGGRWGIIDPSGREIVPIASSRDEILKRGDRP
jgi:hypothetical protein